MNQSPRTHVATISEAVIKRVASDGGVRDLRDLKRPVLLRYRSRRERASWYLRLYRNGKSDWHKVGNWPEISAAALFERLPELLTSAAIEPDQKLRPLGAWQTTGELLTWYRDRVAKDANLSAGRRTNVASIINRHLLPCLGEVHLAKLTRAVVDESLIQRIQAGLKLSYVAQVFAVLPAALCQALDLRLIESNPLAGMQFSQFIKSPILPREAALRPENLRAVLASLGEQISIEPEGVALALLMLCCGTRIGETRQARWSRIDLLQRREWFIPLRETKTKHGDHLVALTNQLCAFLQHYRDWQVSGGYEGDYLFPHRRGRGRRPLSKREASALFQRLSTSEWVSHDLRKVAATGWANLDINPLVIEFLQNHKLGKVTAAYIQTVLGPLRREALERWHAQLDAVGFLGFHSGASPFACVTVTRQKKNHKPADTTPQAGWLSF